MPPRNANGPLAIASIDDYRRKPIAIIVRVSSNICAGLCSGTLLEVWEVIYFKVYKSQPPVVEQVLETAA